MIYSVIEVSGLKEAQNFVDRIPEEMKNAGRDIIQDVATSVQRSAKLRMRFGWSSTGFMKSQTRVKPEGKDAISVSIAARHGAAQEFGFAPHWIPVEFMIQHMNSPGTKGKRVKRPSAWVLPRKPYNPEGYYLGAAWKATEARMLEIIDRNLKKRLK